MRKAICLITLRPNNLYLDFLSKFVNYDIHVVIDDNENDYNELKVKFSTINFIQINNINCLQSGFCNLNYISLRKKVSGWDKALFYFCDINNSYEYIWFMEDDVYFYDENTLLQIDNKSEYKKQDLLCNSSFENGKLNEWLWNKIHLHFDPPYFCGMMCICRFSKKMLECIKEYIERYKTLFFLEAAFPTIAVKNNLNYYKNPSEFITVTYRNTFNINEINQNNLYHPVKNINNQIEYREI